MDDCALRGAGSGLIKVRVFRPFPAEELAKLWPMKAVAVMDKCESFSAHGGPLFLRGSQRPCTIAPCTPPRDQFCLRAWRPRRCRGPICESVFDALREDRKPAAPSPSIAIWDREGRRSSWRIISNKN